MNVCVFSVFHKNYWMSDDKLYIPIQVGFGDKILNPNTQKYILRDNSGDNIANKNKSYCELTALYWVWKNIDFSKYDYIGLDHYRRHFCKKGLKEKKKRILTDDYIQNILQSKKTDIVLPKKRHYFIETNYSQYVHAHHEIDLKVTRDAIKTIYPDYLRSFDKIMNKRSGHRFNMFIMRTEVLEKYCEWLFSILTYVELNLDISSYSEYDTRVFGFIAERLLDVWLDNNAYKQIDMNYFFDGKVNWFKKISNFIVRKISCRKGLYHYA